MGFNKRYLPDLEELKVIHEKFPDDRDFIKFIVGKSDALIGPSESHAYLDMISNRIKKGDLNENACTKL
jgi:hypothetical protein